ncbi:MAG: hypothetical protein K2X81_13455 [Candidatus Obscuribacterales bacterium]|nr:hypothetical protein [Candidatus Obscuribacterales bacterium]
MPEESIKRLRAINKSTSSARHVILTLTYGLYDPNIGQLNRMIVALLLRRMKAERAGESALVARINDFMKLMHEAIDNVTNVVREHPDSSAEVCNRLVRGNKVAR